MILYARKKERKSCCSKSNRYNLFIFSFFIIYLFSSPCFTKQSSCRFEDDPDVLSMITFLMIPEKFGLVIDI